MNRREKIIKNLSEMFKESHGEPVNVDGLIIKSIYTRLILEKEMIELKWNETNSIFKQGIQIKIDDGTLFLNGQKYENITLWEDTCPKSIEIIIEPNKKSVLKIWNIWKVDDSTFAWVGNSGMKISVNQNSIIFNCSDGQENIDFSNLEFVINIKDEVS